MNLNQDKALRAIAGGARSMTAFRAATNSIPWSTMQVVLSELIGAGFVARGRGSVLSLTATGRALIAPPPPAPMKPYVPPPPLARRAGADDWQRIPSLAGDRPVPRGE